MTLDLPTLIAQAPTVAALVSASAALAGATMTVLRGYTSITSQLAVLTSELHADRKAARERGLDVATSMAGINKAIQDIRGDVANTREVQAAGVAEVGALALRVVASENRHDRCCGGG